MSSFLSTKRFTPLTVSSSLWPRRRWRDNLQGEWHRPAVRLAITNPPQLHDFCDDHSKMMNEEWKHWRQENYVCRRDPCKPGRNLPVRL